MTSRTTSAPAPGTAPSDASEEQDLLIQFDDLDQQHDASMLAMWAFLATEVLFFGGLIMAYVVYRTIYRETFAEASHHLNVVMGGVNTVVLLVSSLTMALAVRSAQLKRRSHTVYFLVATMFFGTGFLVVKGFEYYAEYQENLIPFINFVWEEHHDDEDGHGEATTAAATPGAETPAAEHAGDPHAANATTASASASPSGRIDWQDPERKWVPSYADPTLDNYPMGDVSRTPEQRAKLFFVLYFFMTGLHGIHMIIGLVLVGTIATLVATKWFSGYGETPVEVTGLYWHFIDIVWVFLYPLLYLIDIHQ